LKSEIKVRSSLAPPGPLEALIERQVKSQEGLLFLEEIKIVEHIQTNNS